MKETNSVELQEHLPHNKLLPIQSEECKTKLYKYRWVILGLFTLYAATSAFQWIQYCIIANVVIKYYNTTAEAVNWTSLISMIIYPPLIVPTSYIIDKMGLRACALFASVGTCVGTAVKVLSAHPDMFWVTFAGQTIVSAAMMFILSIPPKIASVWFGPSEVSTACSIGVLGTQLGTALGFVLPPILVQNVDDSAKIGMGLDRMYRWVAYYTTTVTVLVILFFRSKPDIPPSVSAAEARKQLKLQNKNESILSSYKRLFTNRGFILLTITYGLNIGVFASVSTVLNQLVLHSFPGGEEFAGLVGLTIVFAGIVGAILFGFILDRTRSYKMTTIVIYIFTTIGMITFSLSLYNQSRIMVYLTSGTLGFFMNAYYPVGFEFASELTYPEQESSSSGVLTSMAQINGILLTYIIQYLLERIDMMWALMLPVSILLIGSVLTMFIPNDLRRQKVLCKASVV